MQMLYHSDSYVVVRFDAPEGDSATPGGGYEIVDKLARREVFLQGAVAERFQRGVQALVQEGPSAEALDEFIAGFTAMAPQPLVLH
jgi:hypothetical protein